jgi:TorA maturation chaperone TorD
MAHRSTDPDDTTDTDSIGDRPVETTGPGAGSEVPPEATLSTAERRDRSAYHASRAALYAGVAGAFCYPDRETLDELASLETAAGLHEAAERTELVGEDTVERFVSSVQAAERDALEASYNDLFGLPADGGYRVVPYEAEYTVEDETSQKQRRIATVSGLLDAFDLERADEFDERRDHVALELELLQVLAARRAVALSPDAEGGTDAETAAEVRRAETTVLSEHLSPFLPAFTHELRAATEDRRGVGASVYRAAGNFAEALVTADVAAHGEGAESQESGGEDGRRDGDGGESS